MIETDGLLRPTDGESRGALLAISICVTGLLGVALGALRPEVGAVALALAVAATLILTKPTWALAVMFLAIPLERFTSPLGPVELTPVQITAMLIVTVLVASSITRGHVPLSRTPFDVPIMVWLSVSFLGTITAVDPAAAVKKAGIFVVYVIIYYLAASAITSTPKARLVLRGFILAATIVAAYGIWVEYLYLTAGIVTLKAMTVGSEGLAVPRVASTMINTSALAALMTLSVPIAVALVVTTDWRAKPIAIVALGILMTALGFTFTRGAWLGTSVALLLMATEKRVRGTIIALGIVVLLLAPGVVSQRAASATQTSRPEITARFDFWSGAVKMIDRRPLLGVGTNNFQAAWARLQAGWTGRFAATAHNVFLNLLVENGVVGFVAFFMILGGVLVMCLVRKGTEADPEASIYLLGVGGSIVAFLMHQLTDSLLTEPAIILPVWTLMGVAVALRTIESRDARLEDRSPDATPTT